MTVLPTGQPLSFESLLKLVAIARGAGDLIERIRVTGDFAPRPKSDESPVTKADMAAHTYLTKALLELLPNAALISEEDGASAKLVGERLKGQRLVWLVDPLDGTRDFLAGTGDYTVNIALLIEGRLAAGVVHAPARGAAWAALRGLGAFRQVKANGDLVAIRCRPMPSKGAVCLVSRFHAAGEARRLDPVARDRGARIVAVGSSLKYVLIASGEADISLRRTPTCPWDTAAAQCILEEAGGAMVDAAGQPLNYDEGRDINPPFVSVGDRSADWGPWAAAAL